MSNYMKKFDIFKKECQHWIDRFELNNWGTEIKIDEKPSTDRCLAYIINDDESFLSSIFFVPLNNKESSIESINYSAKHEVIHLLLARLSALGRKRHCSGDEIYAAEEELVQKLLKIIK